METSKLENGQMAFTGLLDAVKKVDTEDGVKHIHKFLIASPDNYTPPTTLFIGSPRQIIDVGKEATVICRPYGWSRKFRGKDGKTYSNQNHALEEVI